MERNLKLTVAYDGTNYHGYQDQPGLKTVEGRLKEALEATFLQEIDLKSAGRTDKGVHSQGQVVNFKVDTDIDLGNLPRVVNFNLPPDISVLGVQVVDQDFHARFSAKAKLYRYVIYNGRYRNPLYENRACFVHFPLDEKKMEEALKDLPGLRDFGVFMGRHAVVKDTYRNLYRVDVKRKKDLIVVHFYGKSFLKNMIRRIMGTSIEIGRGLKDTNTLKRALESQDKTYLGPTAPAEGLYLMRVDY